MDTNALNKNISCKLKILRNEKNYTQSSVASVLSISQNYYSEIENGKKRLQLHHLPKLVDLYGVNVEYFFE